MPTLLTKKKSLWVSKRKPQQLKGLALNPNAASEDRYYIRLRRLILQMTTDTESQVRKLYAKPVAQAYFAQDDTMSAQAKLVMARLVEKFQGIFDIASTPYAARMTAEQSASSASSLEASLKKLSGGLTLKTSIISGDLKDILAATIQENVALIKSIPSQYFTQIEGAVMRSITTGNGEADLVPFLKKYEGVTIKRARIIARDQTRKAFANLNAARMQKIGIDEYEWLHSAGGQKPRKLHQRMSGEKYSLSNPPVIDEKTGQRGKPGDLINCRCRMVPIIKFNEE